MVKQRKKSIRKHRTAHLNKVLKLAPKSEEAADARRIFKEYRSLEG